MNKRTKKVPYVTIFLFLFIGFCLLSTISLVPMTVHTFKTKGSSKWSSLPSTPISNITQVYLPYIDTTIDYIVSINISQLISESDKNYDTYSVTMQLARYNITTGSNNVETKINITARVHPYDKSNRIPYAVSVDATPETGGYFPVAISFSDASYSPITSTWVTNIYTVHVIEDHDENVQRFVQQSLINSYSALGSLRNGTWTFILKLPDASHNGNSSVAFAPIDGRIDITFYISGYAYTFESLDFNYSLQFTISIDLYDLHYDGTS